MKRSIRFRFTALFIGMLAAVLLAIWVINSFFLEQYYINDKVKILQDAYEQLNDCAVEQALERLTMQLLGEENVREACLFPRDLNRLEP